MTTLTWIVGSILWLLMAINYFARLFLGGDDRGIYCVGMNVICVVMLCTAAILDSLDSKP